MESINVSNSEYKNKSIPKERRIKSKDTCGNLDTLGFYRTPNGSFWDPDDEYFNRFGFDVHAGQYSKELEYVPGPEWLAHLGCYPDEKDKYENVNMDEMSDDKSDTPEEAEAMAKIEAEFKGDFEDNYQEGDEPDFSMEDLMKIQMGDKKMLDQLMAQYGLQNLSLGNNSNKPSKKNKKQKNKKNTPKEEEDEGWETVEEDEDVDMK